MEKGDPLGCLKIPTYRNVNADPLVKWIRSVSVRCEIIKLLEENGEKQLHIGLGHDFLGRTPKAQATRAKPDKWMA